MGKSIIKTKSGISYLYPFILVTSLFFLWGFAHSFLDVLNKHFQMELHLTKALSAFIQLAVYGGYFLTALPAGMFIRRFGYRAGVILGLVLYGVGALLFIPGSHILSFPFFLFSLFIIGCGLTCLETAANPYVTILGEENTASSRLNLSQSFNGLGWIVGPLVGGLIVFTVPGGNIALPYTIVGVVVILVGILFARVTLPDVTDHSIPIEITVGQKKIWEYPHFIFGVVALFFYVAAQTGVNSFFINYVTESIPHVSNRTASLMLSFGGMGLFMAGRFLGSWLMKNINDVLILSVCSAMSALSMLLVMLDWGWVSVGALFANYLFMSIMFPTIFSLAIRNLGALTPKASSILIMSIVGGAIAPVLMGLIGEVKMSTGFIIPLICFLIIWSYSFFLIKKSKSN
jgi:FHS family L-fucose permease-like MFS transporter